MREPTLLVLTSLAGGRKHGYALIADALDLSAGRVRLKAGSLYAVLDRLVGEGLVRAAGDEVVDGRARRYFEITESGIDALQAEVQRLEANATAARARIAIWRPGNTVQFGGIQ